MAQRNQLDKKDQSSKCNSALWDSRVWEIGALAVSLFWRHRSLWVHKRQPDLPRTRGKASDTRTTLDACLSWSNSSCPQEPEAFNNLYADPSRIEAYLDNWRQHGKWLGPVFKKAHLQMWRSWIHSSRNPQWSKLRHPSWRLFGWCDHVRFAYSKLAF